MRTYLIRAAFVVAALSLASPAFAAYNDVTLSTDVSLSINSITLNVYGASTTVESITVSDTSFTATLQANSSLVVQAPSGNILNYTSDQTTGVSTVCTSATSTLTVSASATTNITVTPSSSTCPRTDGSGSSSGSGSNGPVASGGGGGGGGGAVIPAAPTLPAAATTNKNPTAVAAHFKALVRALRKGNTGADVKVLQQMLNSDPDTQVALSGVGSPGKETTLFGTATLAAIKKFQVKWGIAKPGDQGYGNVGPKTRAKLNELYSR